MKYYRIIHNDVVTERGVGTTRTLIPNEVHNLFNVKYSSTAKQNSANATKKKDFQDFQEDPETPTVFFVDFLYDTVRVVYFVTKIHS